VLLCDFLDFVQFHFIFPFLVSACRKGRLSITNSLYY
jgi:hypothetical protein